ncbi:response regulator [Rubellimicrobium roseum]|uniref:Response regulator n=1 Tax=Rubellimicrobium roseum TaxID=687525 RepID=A0A5C4NA56_9RHOB|nr:response regulator [Rubellimicrobium roseum]TNC68275.1 response regulator [Rubellimicrobium roseum]
MLDHPEASLLRGRCILVVEDEYVVAEDICRELVEQGAEVVGPVPTVQSALTLLAADRLIDGAILDINLRGEMVFPVAKVLRDRGTPFLFATGYDMESLPQAYDRVPCCEKPFEVGQGARALFGSGRALP